MVAVAAAHGQDHLFEFNASAPEFVPIQGGSPVLSPSSPVKTDSSLAAEALPPDGGGGSSSSEATFRESQEVKDVPRAISCSPHLLACDSSSAGAFFERGGGTRAQQRRQTASSMTSSARRSCATAPASPALTCTSSSSSGRQQGLNRRTSNTEEVATLVIKNLSLDFRKEDVEKYLVSHGAGFAEVELHVDPASGAFRGTVFVRYPSPGKARDALQKLGSSPEIGGRKARVEIQKSKNLFGRKSPGGELPQELAAVQHEIEKFVRDPLKEVCLSASFDAHQRKYAHSLAERHSLVHATRQNESGATYVYLSKCRANQPVSNRKKAHSVDIQSSQLSGLDATKDGSGYEGSHSCYAGLMSPPGLVIPGLELGTPMMGLCSPELLAAQAAVAAADEASMFMLPNAALPVPPPGMDLPGCPGLPASVWPSAVLSSLAMLGQPQPPPGLEVDPDGQKLLQAPSTTPEAEKPDMLDAASTEDNSSSQANSGEETEHS